MVACRINPGLCRPMRLGGYPSQMSLARWRHGDEGVRQGSGVGASGGSGRACRGDARRRVRRRGRSSSVCSPDRWRWSKDNIITMRWRECSQANRRCQSQCGVADIGGDGGSQIDFARVDTSENWREIGCLPMPRIRRVFRLHMEIGQKRFSTQLPMAEGSLLRAAVTPGCWATRLSVHFGPLTTCRGAMT
jgi:hypothetical protein